MTATCNANMCNAIFCRCYRAGRAFGDRGAGVGSSELVLSCASARAGRGGGVNVSHAFVG